MSISACRRPRLTLAATRLVVATLVLALLVACATRAPSAVAAPTRVTPLGDSITDGYNLPGGYRIDLEDALVAGGHEVDFVGSLANGPDALADREHEGHSGWRIDQVAASANRWLTASEPQVVLLLIGTNDVLQQHAVGTAPQRLAALIDQISVVAPSASLLVASLPPLAATPADATREDRLRAYNAVIPQIVAERAAQGRRVSFVDMHAGLTTGDLADGVHPNAGGYRRMAALWHAALRQVLPGREAASPPGIPQLLAAPPPAPVPVEPPAAPAPIAARVPVPVSVGARAGLDRLLARARASLRGKGLRGLAATGLRATAGGLGPGTLTLGVERIRGTRRTTIARGIARATGRSAVTVTARVGRRARRELRRASSARLVLRAGFVDREGRRSTRAATIVVRERRQG
jgi:lysophospholipase L1-like esterase